MRESTRLTIYTCSGLLLTLIILSLSSVYRRAESSCTVIITGESLTIRGCEFTPDFIEYAKTLRVAKHW
uniref:Movement protein TGBp3 n=1 Tax=Garlic common latent virus TaxID=47900 RepID=A0A6M2YTM0_9VIRU|nr:TGB3 [Garlic common latent virus]QED43248.1 TGB3 [Garlic common latent virus]